MKKTKTTSGMNAAASRMRALIGEAEEGTFLGGEGAMMATLGVSRTTLRQVARLLEREGLLSVKRGQNGGYFAKRPSFSSIEESLSAYLEILDVRIDELVAIASITWTESVRQASRLQSDNARNLMAQLVTEVQAVDRDISTRELIKIEQGIRSAVFDLIHSPYMRLLFEVNVRFAQQQFEGPGQIPETSEDQVHFVADWRNAKLLELEAIVSGDDALALLATERTRQIWTRMMPLRSASDS